MKAKFSKILLILSVFVTIYSCNKIYNILSIDQYILSYYQFNDNMRMKAKNISDSVCLSTLYRITEELPFCSAQSLRKDGYGSMVDASPKNFEAYDSLRKKYNDLSYPAKSRVSSYSITTDPGVLYCGIERVEIVCDVDWDPNHPKNSLLNNLFDIRFCSHYPYIKSGYQENLKVLDLNNDYHLTYTKKPLSELSKTDLLLLDRTSEINFYAKKPKNDGEYNITVILYTDDLKKHEFKIKYTK